jgi:hypothetical protein
MPQLTLPPALPGATFDPTAGNNGRSTLQDIGVVLVDGSDVILIGNNSVTELKSQLPGSHLSLYCVIPGIWRVSSITGAWITGSGATAITITGEVVSVKKLEPQAVTASTTLVDVIGLSMNIPRDQKVKFEFYVPFSLADVASGWKFQVVLSTAFTNFVNHVLVFDGVTPGAFVNSTVQVASAAVAGALAVAGNHICYCTGQLENSNNGGLPINIKLQFAQNVADAGAITILRGAYLIVTKI